MKFEIGQLHEFLTIVRRGSVSLAARELAVYQSSLSRSMQRLERTLGAKLFHHRTSGLTLTAEGKKFVPHAERMLEECDRALMDIGVRSGEIQHLRIGISGGFLTDWMPNWFNAVRKKRPDLRVSFVPRSYEHVMTMLKARDLDIGVVQALEFSRIQERMDRDLNFKFCGEESLMPFAPTDHAIARRRRPTLADAAKHDWALPFDMSARMPFESAFVSADLTPPRSVIESSSLEFLHRVAREQGLLALLPESFRAHARTMKQLDIPELRITYQIIVLTLRSAARSKQLAAFVDLLTQTRPT